jgi:uncharacterized protein YjiS (DUF1127 family)
MDGGDPARRVNQGNQTMPSHSVPIDRARRIEPAGRFVLLLRALSVGLGRQRMQVELDRLNDRQLQDIGIERTREGFRAVISETSQAPAGKNAPASTRIPMTASGAKTRRQSGPLPSTTR